MKKSVKLSLAAAAVVLIAALGTPKYLRWKEERRRSGLQSNLKQLDPAIEEKRKAEWEKKLGHHHPRATVQGLKIDPESKRLMVEVRSFINVAPYAWSTDEIEDAVQLSIDGKLQEKSGLGSYSAKGKPDAFTFDMKSLEPVKEGQTYALEVTDRSSEDKEVVKVAITKGKAVRVDD